MDDLRSKLPPDLQGKFFDMKDMDMDSLKAKLEAMKLEKQGGPCLCFELQLLCHLRKLGPAGEYSMCYTLPSPCGNAALLMSSSLGFLHSSAMSS